MSNGESHTPLPLVTGVAQQRRFGSVYAATSPSSPPSTATQLPDGNHTVACGNGTWLHHGNVGYVLLNIDTRDDDEQHHERHRAKSDRDTYSEDGGSGSRSSSRSSCMSLSVFSGPVAGNWNSIGFSNKSTNASMFRASIRHPATTAVPADFALAVQVRHVSACSVVVSVRRSHVALLLLLLLCVVVA